MANNIYVGGFPYKTTPDELTKLFSTCGTVVHAKVILDRETGRPKGFGFVEMSTDAEAKNAVAKLNGAMLGGRKIFAVEGRADKNKRPAVPGAPAAPKGAPKFGEPGFVERRSGKDRRAQAAPGSDRRDIPAKKPTPPYGGEVPPPHAVRKGPWEKKPYDPSKKWPKKTWPKKTDAAPKPFVKTVPPIRGKKWVPPHKD